MTDNPTLFGHDSEERLIGVHREGNERVRLYTREQDGSVSSRTERFHPFLYLSQEAWRAVDSAFGSLLTRTLPGGAHYDRLVVFEDWQQYRECVKYLRTLADREDIRFDSFFQVTSPESQYLMQTGKTLFKGMAFKDVRRMQLDIETYTSEGGFPNAARPKDEIIIIALSDSTGWERTIHGLEYSERDMLVELVREIQRRDPDVIELHNGFGFDLPYIRDRCRMHRVNFAIGRDQQSPRSYMSKKKFAERDFEYENFIVAGRSVVDTMFMSADFDVIKRDLPGLGLKAVAEYFGFNAPDREYVPGPEISYVWDTDPDRLLRYALDDVRETGKIGARLGGSTFYLTQMLPMDHQKVHLGGTAGSIQTLFVREYLRRRESLPKPEEGTQEHGGYTDIFQTGIFENLLYADVASLYPSIMLFFNVAPSSDRLGLFRNFLESLTHLRLDVKGKMNDETDPEKKSELDAQQGSFKLIINSFYGMLGWRWGLFNDFSEADRVALTGQALLKRMMQVIEDMGGDVVECDTDGVLFVRPDFVLTPDEFEQEGARYTETAFDGSQFVTDDDFVKEISRRMPRGIEIDMDGRYERMLSYRKKNYILRDYSGKVKTKGGSFKNRGIEPFGRDYVQKTALALLDRDVEALHSVHEDFKTMVATRDWGPADFCKRATLKTSIAEYDDSLDNPNKSPQAQYELAKRVAERDGRTVMAGDVIHYYISGNKPKSRVTGYIDAKVMERHTPGDENTAYYLGRLQTFSKKWKDFFTKEDFGKVFATTVTDPNQSNLFDLPLDLSGIQVVNTRIKPIPQP